MTRPYTHAAEKYINEYVDLMLAGDKVKARHLRPLLIKHLHYTPVELDIFVEERIFELERAAKLGELDDTKMAVEELTETS